MRSSLRRKTIAGIIWAGIGQLGSQAIRYVVLLVLAWLLSPADFGLLGLVMIFINLAGVVGELGVAPAIVHKSNVAEPALSTVFWVNLVVSIIMAAFTYLRAETITGFLGDTTAAPLLQVLSVIFPIMALAVVPRALLRKHLEFNRLSVRDLASELAFGVVGLTMAVSGVGVWSLVGAAVAQRLASTAMLWVAVPWRPKLEFDLQCARSLLSFGLPVMTASVFAKGIANIDYFVVGHWLGTEALGYYTLAFQLGAVPAQRLMGILRTVAFPAFSSIQHDLTRLKTGFLEGIQYLFVVLTPVSLFLAVLAPWFIRAVYGEKWLPSVQPVHLLAFAGFFYGFDVAESVYYAVGRPQVRILVIGLRLALFAVFAVTFGLSLGITGVAISLMLSVAMTSLVGVIVVSHITHASWRELLEPVWLSVRAALWACIPPVLFGFFPPLAVSPWVVLLGLGFVMTLIYILAVAPAYRDLLGRLSVTRLRHWDKRRARG